MANKRKKPNYYAVRVGRKPGIYNTWDECQEQVLKFSGAAFKGFDTYNEALTFVGDAIVSNKSDTDDEDDYEEDEDEYEEEEEDRSSNTSVSRGRSNSPSPAIVKIEVGVEVEDDAAFMPPPASQSYFDQFPNFEPDNNASFDDEFSRFASSQGIVSGSQEYRTKRTKAICDELKFHYSSQPNPAMLETIPEADKNEKNELSEEEKLDIYQNMCREIGVESRDTINECRQELKRVLVNIVDYIDARRVPGKKVEIWPWSDFDGFSAYTLQDEKRIDINVAKADGGFLSALLQRLSRSGSRIRKGQTRAPRRVSSFEAKRKSVDHDEYGPAKRVCGHRPP